MSLLAPGEIVDGFGCILYGFGMDLGRFGSLWMDFIWIYMDLDGFG